MGLRLNSNALSLALAKNIHKNTDKFSREALKISTGKRINYAGDDAAGAAIVSKLKAELAGFKQAKRNANDALSLVQTSEGSLNEVNNILLRMRELALQGTSDSLAWEDAAIIDMEFFQLKDEIDRISAVTSYNGIPLLKGKNKTLDFQVGIHSGKNNVISLNLGATNTTTESLGIGNLGVYYRVDSEDTLGEIDKALSTVSMQRAYLGAKQERLAFAASHIDSTILHKEDARSVIEDVDYAESISKMVKAKIMQDFSVAALAQANSMPSTLLKLL